MTQYVIIQKYEGSYKMLIRNGEGILSIPVVPGYVPKGTIILGLAKACNLTKGLNEAHVSSLHWDYIKLKEWEGMAA